MAKIKETQRVRIPSVPAFFVSRVTRDASTCEKHFPRVISWESGRRPPPQRFAPRGRTSPYSPEMTGEPIFLREKTTSSSNGVHAQFH